VSSFFLDSQCRKFVSLSSTIFCFQGRQSQTTLLINPAVNWRYLLPGVMCRCWNDVNICWCHLMQGCDFPHWTQSHTAALLWSHTTVHFIFLSYDFAHRGHNLGTAAKQIKMVRAYVAKRRQWLGEEMYGVQSGGFQTERLTNEDLERGCEKRLSSMQIEQGRCYGL